MDFKVVCCQGLLSGDVLLLGTESLVILRQRLPPGWPLHTCRPVLSLLFAVLFTALMKKGHVSSGRRHGSCGA